MNTSPLTAGIEDHLRTQSWIRKMFESSLEMKKKYGDDQVFDFSLGNPDVPAPAAMGAALRELAARSDQARLFGYVPNAGWPPLREALAHRLAGEQEVPLRADRVVVTCGAAGALNALFRAVLAPGDEVVCPSPYFVEYRFYAENVGAKLHTAACAPPSFALDIDAMDEAIGPRTRAVLINSPNNPTGQVYGRDELEALAALLRRRSAGRETPILLVSDEPYRFLTYDGTEAPPLFPLYEQTVIVGSFSKSHSLAGERIGYLAINPAMEKGGLLADGLTLTNRILGFVNAPIIAQRVLPELLDHAVDVRVYDERRHAMAGMLDAAGVEYTLPRGAFYFFPAVPRGWDDLSFVSLLLEEHIIAVPGSGFGAPGFFRLAYCVGREVIERAVPAFERAMQRAGEGPA